MKKRWKTDAQTTLAWECKTYLKSNSVFERLLGCFREKYSSYGNFAGTVTLNHLKKEELEVLEGFLQRNLHGQKSVTISAARFEKALQNSRFAELTPKDVLELYFEEDMIGKKAQREMQEKRWKELLQRRKQQYRGTYAADWIENLLDQRNGMYAYIRRQQNESEEGGYDEYLQEADRLLQLGAEVINQLPLWQKQTVYLAVFAARITGNPHAFDEGMREGTYLYQLIQWVLKFRNISIRESEVFPLMKRQRSYLAVGILRDDISNYVILSGVRAWNLDGKLHVGMEGFLQEGHMVQVPLSVIAQWGRLECTNQEIYIVENPSVYAIFSERWKGKRACMCMNGQPRLSSLLVLELLARSKTRIYYAGDFDPEGLLIAQKLKLFYDGNLEYWHMSREDYRKSLSRERISEKRLNSLKRITDRELQEVVEEMRECGLAGYQENLIW